MSWEQESFIDDLSNGAIKEFLSNSVDEHWIIQTFGSIDKCVEIMANNIAEDDNATECVDEILSIILTKLLDKDHTKEY
jgi:hypothetical protein